ncbi:Response regulators consisting of a CheY-like receiver domain and a winged-helix DNA-binding domain [Variovorax sp. HW608]|uniref:response regulator n=1 Tax=Variovorax sp. HW608 TaxID=1034889 RepID=UPI00081F9CFD|nr:response regulator [Variovorax sp. HW608]SCK27069.1 Response regulators consisting of a CheY-like receiver domain and a winged-helix DNA-binding domain [Variovorax sp. HW608]
MGDDVRTTFDFSEVFTVAARHVLRRISSRDLRLSFDHRGPLAIIEGEAVAMRRSLHRMLFGAIDELESGHVALEAQTHLTPSGHYHVDVKATGSGVLATQGVLSTVIARLKLTQQRELAEQAEQPRLRRASGDCPITGARIDFEGSPSAGMLLRAHWALSDARPVQDTPAVPDAHGSVAWIIDDRDAASSLLMPRLQRLGWATVRFASRAEAARRLRSPNGAGEHPSLLIVIESQDTPPLALRALREQLPASTECIYGVVPGSPSLIRRNDFDGFKVLVRPFSPAQLRRLTAGAATASERASCSMPQLLGATQRRALVMVVDDDDVSRRVTATMARALGFDVVTACDGEEAVEQCERMHPAAVLMDLDLPSMDGIRVAQRLRELERAGALAPCIIVAVAADGSEQARLTSAVAGMDGYLTKPLSTSSLGTELHRLCAGCVAPA